MAHFYPRREGTKETLVPRARLTGGISFFSRSLRTNDRSIDGSVGGLDPSLNRSLRRNELLMDRSPKGQGKSHTKTHMDLRRELKCNQSFDLMWHLNQPLDRNRLTLATLSSPPPPARLIICDILFR